MGGRHEQKMCSDWQQSVVSESTEPVQRLQQGIPWNRDTKPFTVREGGYTDSEIGLDWKKNVKVPGEAASADEEAAGCF